MRIVLASCQNLPDWEMDDIHFHRALSEQGIDFEVLPWDDASISWERWAQFDACVIRTTWGYDQHLEAFLQWVDRLSQYTLILNSPDIIHWNSRKSYLKDLQAKGIPIAPTFWVNSQSDLSVILQGRSESHFFLKPEVGACARHTKRFHCNDITEVQQWLIAQNQNMLLQPYLKSVETEGEYSVIYFGAVLSHCVQKIPVEGDYRVQDDFGATDFAIEPPIELQQLSEQILSVIPKVLYARIDVLRLDTGEWVLNELELIEPSLFFRHSTTAAELFLKQLLCHLSQKTIG